MKIFKNYTFTWLQVGVLKTALLLVGIAIGASWPQIFEQYTTILAVIGLLLGIYIAAISFKDK